MSFPFDNAIFKSRLAAVALLLGLIVLVSAIRFQHINSQGLWLDEIYTISLLSGYDPYLFEGADLTPNTALRPAESYIQSLEDGRFIDRFPRNIIHEGHPPLFYLGLKLWAHLSGSELAELRLFSIIFSALAIGLIYLVGAFLYDRKTAAIAATLFSLSPMQAFFSLELRGYSLAVCLCAAATLFAFKWAHSAKRFNPQAVAWTIFSLAACLTHYYALIYIICLATSIIWVRRGASDPPASIRDLSVLSVPALLFAFWTPVLYLQTVAHGDTHWTQGSVSIMSSLQATLETIVTITIAPGIGNSGFSWVSYILLGLFALLFVAAQRSVKYKSADRVLGITCFLFFTSVMLLDSLLDKHTILVPRYSIFLAIPIFLLIARALTFRAVLGPFLLLTYGLFLTYLSSQIVTGDIYPKQMLREAAYYIDNQRTKSAAVLVSPSGPSLIGMALYFSPNVPLAGSSPDRLKARIAQLRSDGYREIWVVEQRLGLRYEPWATENNEEPSELVRFAGLDVKKY